MFHTMIYVVFSNRYIENKIYNNKGVNSFLKLESGGANFPLCPPLRCWRPWTTILVYQKSKINLFIYSPLFAITSSREILVSFKVIELFHNTYSININDHYLNDHYHLIKKNQGFCISFIGKAIWHVFYNLCHLLQTAFSGINKLN